MIYLAGLQRAAITGLAAELRAGGSLTVLLAFSLGALHALTPGHGKAALAAYFLGQQARLGTGLRVTVAAAFLHVVTGLLAFLVLRFAVSQTPLMTGRGSPFFAVVGYSLILIAGAVMLVQSLRPSTATGRHPHVLTVGIGLLPCPLTITVLGFAWAQGSVPMVVVVLISLAAGIAFTIGAVALCAIVARRRLGQSLIHRVSDIERWLQKSQAVAGAIIVVIASYSLWTAL